MTLVEICSRFSTPSKVSFGKTAEAEKATFLCREWLSQLLIF